MIDFGLVTLLVIAIAVGWLLAWYEAKKKYTLIKNTTSNLNRGYFLGLNYLLNEQPDQAIDEFLNAFEINSDTVEIYLVLGSLFRRRGEVDRAIRVHQDLLARPNLDPQQQSQVQLALARDYLSAGLLDRAERLLEELVAQGGEYRHSAIDDLVNIYEQEKDWHRAIEAGEMLLKIGDPNLLTVWQKPKENVFDKPRPAYNDAQIQCALAHYCCELVEHAMVMGDWLQAKQYLKQAMAYDRNSVRSSLLLGQVEFQLGHPKEAIKLLKKIRHQEPVYFSEALPLLDQCYRALNKEDEWLAYLKSCLVEQVDLSLLLFLADCLQKTQGDSAAQRLILDYLPKQPTPSVLQRLLVYKMQSCSHEEMMITLTLLQQWITHVVELSPKYQCGHCGFSGKTLHWMCPSCKRWGTVKPLA